MPFFILLQNNLMDHNPILNSPYDSPEYHYATDPADGSLDYNDIRKGRRIFVPEMQVIPVRQGPQKAMFEVNDLEGEYGDHLVNLIRKEVGKWRDSKYSDHNPTRVTRELLLFWFENPERHAIKKLFFCQREAVETAIWLNEIAPRYNAGQHVLNLLRQAQTDVSDNAAFQLPRIAFKMATGSGKTVVMACFILYHFFNRQEYPQDTRFADNFLIVAPGITIRDRLGVLKVDTLAAGSQHVTDYYHVRGLVPPHYERLLLNLNSRIVITNYHAFEPKTLKGNKQSPFDGKLNRHGEKQDNKEDFSQTVRRLMGAFKPGSRLLILNDEAHHCYLPKSDNRKAEDENTTEENQRAAVWFRGMANLCERYKVSAIYDLSATPYYLTGSGYDPYSLFGWVVSDFGLIEAIESGLVKIPFLPESDNTQELSMPVLRNLYEHVRDDLPKKGQRGARKAAKEKGEKLKEQPPRLPSKLKAALDQFYDHYKKTYDHFGQQGQLTMEDTPPVFIVVCNNTSVSKEVYKYLAGYEIIGLEGEVEDVVHGAFDLFSNYDRTTRRPKLKSPTLLIDSEALEDSDQIGDDFKKIFASEIEAFKREYAHRHGQGAVEKITDAEILREVVNTVGKPGTLGGHIRCVVSVSMLTEGWDANTVTHIVGLRAFGSQLLCEQVAGRALRRREYFLQNYSRESGELIPPDKANRYKPENIIQKYPPEYAHIIGVPFKMFKGGTTAVAAPVDYTRVHALHERQAAYEISFPNLNGYRIETVDGPLKWDFSEVENYELDTTKIPLETDMETAFAGMKEKLRVRSVLERRDQELIYLITKEMINRYYTDEEGNPLFFRFNQLKKVVEEWYATKIILAGSVDPAYKRLLFFESPEKYLDFIYRGIFAGQQASDRVLPIFNYYNKFGSTKYVNGNTSKPVYPTVKSHVNYVVADTESWEQLCAKALEEMEEVEAYVKNEFLGFTIPYVSEDQERRYFPDFIARCKTPGGARINLIIEITGANKKDKATKKYYVDKLWLPAVNAVRDKYGYDEWRFVEVAEDIRFLKNEIMAAIQKQRV